MKDMVFGSTSTTSSGMRSIVLYTLSLSFFSGDFFFTDQDTGIAGVAEGLCPGGMELARSDFSLDTCEAGSDMHSAYVNGLATDSSGFLGGLPGH